MNHDSKFIEVQHVEQTFKTAKGLFPALRQMASPLPPLVCCCARTAKS